MNESCQIWMSHVTCEWDVSHVSESCLIYRQTKPSTTNKPYAEIRNINFNVTQNFIFLSLISRNSVSHNFSIFLHRERPLAPSCHDTCERVMSHVHTPCHMSFANTSWHTWMKHYTHEWGMSHVNVPCHCHMSFVCVHTAQLWHSACLPWLVGVRHDSFIFDMAHSRVPWRISKWHMTWSMHMWHDSFTCDMTRWRVSWIIHIWHGSFAALSLSACVWNMTHLHVTWLIRMWHDCMGHGPFNVTDHSPSYAMCKKVMAHVNASCPIYRQTSWVPRCAVCTHARCKCCSKRWS